MAALAVGCQSPTDPDDTISADEVVDVLVSPDPIQARESGDGKTYRIVVNEETETRAYDWKATFDLTVVLNSNAASDDLSLEFPLALTSASFKVEQASGGIRNPPTGGDSEHYESIIVQSTGNQYPAVNSFNVMTVDIWYDLPSLRREALVTATLGFKDNEGRTFTRIYEGRIAP